MKSLLHTHFGTQVPREGIAIAHLELPRLTARNSVILIDTSDAIAQNTFFEKEIEFTLDKAILTYFLEKRGFIVTDRFSGTKPLYFKHQISTPIYVDSEGRADILITDDSGAGQDTALYHFDCGKKVIYHSFSPDRIFFVIYPRVDDSNNIIDRRHRELLEAAPAFVPVASKDILDEGIVSTDADGFILTELDGSPHFWRITLPRATKYSLKYTEAGLFRLRIPTTAQGDPWFPEIQQTVLLTKQFREDRLLRYTVREFELQNFYPFPPIRLTADKTVTQVAAGVLETGEKHIVITTKTPVDVKIYGSEGHLVQALTTDENKIGLTIEGIHWEVGLIETIDRFNGRISVRRNLRPGEIAKASFYFESAGFQYTGYNLNPLYNTSAMNQRVAIFCRPQVEGCDKTIGHVVMDLSGNLISSSDKDITEWLTGKTWNDFQQDWLYIPGISISNENNFLLLGLLSVAIPIAPDQLKITDARVRGGGLVPEQIDQVLQLMPGAVHNWDLMYWDGPPKPIQNTAILYLPKYLQGVFSEDEIRSRASKYAPAGMHFIIRFFESQAGKIQVTD